MIFGLANVLKTIGRVITTEYKNAHCSQNKY